MPVIRLSDATFVDLKSIATWLGTGTPSETIDQLVRDKMLALGLERDDEPEAASTESEILVFEKTPGLSFTKVLSARIDGRELPKANWAGILLSVIGAVKSKGLSVEKLVSELEVPSRVSDYEQDGYRYHPELGISVQGQSAPDAWKEASRLAKRHGIALEVTFRWRDNDKAQYPGKTGILRS